MTIFASWNDARKAARKAMGPVTGFIENTYERGRYVPIVCGARAGEVTGPCQCGSIIFG